VVVNTPRLFGTLLRRMHIDVVCDIGSMNGAEALAFRDAVPQADIYALEPNPENFRRMQANPLMQRGHIQLLAAAATNFDGTTDFFVVDADPSEHTRRGMSSLYRRSDAWSAASHTVRVKAARLDSLLADRCRAHASLALWIDTEGKGYEVIEGCAGLARRIAMLHVEVETSPCIAAEQKLYPQVRALLERQGFRELATDQPRSRPQFNALYVRADQRGATRARTSFALAGARLRYLLVAFLMSVCPVCVRRYHGRRLGRRRRDPQLP
jgi:FkbM family methyltransferase